MGAGGLHNSAALPWSRNSGTHTPTCCNPCCDPCLCALFPSVHVRPLARQATHSVRWGLAPDALTSNSSSTAPSRTYTHFGWVGHLHAANMSGLAPGTRYYYSVGDAKGGT